MSQVQELPRSISALDKVFSVLEREFERNGIDERTRFCVNLAAEELFTNMVRHNVVGENARITLSLEVDEEKLTLRLVDEDVEPWDPETAPNVDPSAPAEARQPGGLGIHLVRSVVDKISYEYSDRQMRVRVVKKREH